MASSQHRCVFVGNIPYDATEEQLIEICREVGPVVSFRLVIDRETGKPKGYGFCEYKDEETALSARRNLQGYVINGRQLRVDFAENDKGSDRNREQGRGGPGLATTVDTQKQLGGTAIHGDSVQHQPIGLHLSIIAAGFMAGAIGGVQAGLPSNQNGLQSAATDPLTLHLAKMSRSQLNEIMSELKKMATQNKDQARELLLARPQLLKAIFQAQIMLGLVPPQMLQILNPQQAVGQLTQPLLQDIHQNQQPTVQTHPALPPLAPRLNSSLIAKAQENQVSATQSSVVPNQYLALLQQSLHPRIHLPQLSSSPAFPPVTLPGPSVAPRLLSVNTSVRPQIQVANSSFLKQQVHPQMSQQQGQLVAASVGQSSQMVLPNSARPSSFLTRSPLLDISLQASPVNPGIEEKKSMVHDPAEAINRPSKMVKLDDGRTPFSVDGANMLHVTGSGPARAFGGDSARLGQIPGAGQMQPSDIQISQPQLPSDLESALLRQVLNLSPEQLNSLPPEQRQQVIQLQQALRQDQMQPS